MTVRMVRTDMKMIRCDNCGIVIFCKEPIPTDFIGYCEDCGHEIKYDGSLYVEDTSNKSLSGDKS